MADARRRLSLRLRFSSALLAGLLMPAVASAASVEACRDQSVPEALRVQQLEMTTWDRSGQERTMKGLLYGTREDGRDRVMARVEFPGDLAGSAFLMREAEPSAEMYVYLPAARRVKRLAGAAMSGKLWGTDFTYNEFRRIANAFSGGTVLAEAAQRVEGRPVHVVTLSSPPADGEPYDAIRVLVDQQTCVPLRAEFKKGAQVRKRMSVPSAQLRQAAGHWYSAEVTLSDLVEGTRTRLRVLGVKPEETLSPRFFHPQQFHSAR